MQPIIVLNLIKSFVEKKNQRRENCAAYHGYIIRSFFLLALFAQLNIVIKPNYVRDIIPDWICLGNIEFSLGVCGCVCVWCVCFVVDLRIEFAYLLPCDDVGHAKIFWLHTQCWARTYGHVNKHISVDGPSHSKRNSNNNNNRVYPFKAGYWPRPATDPLLHLHFLCCCLV